MFNLFTRKASQKTRAFHIRKNGSSRIEAVIIAKTANEAAAIYVKDLQKNSDNYVYHWCGLTVYNLEDVDRCFINLHGAVEFIVTDANLTTW